MFPALVALTPIAFAQVVTETTPDPLEVQRIEWSLSGRTYALSDYSLFESHVNLPFGLDFYTGHGVYWGTELNSKVGGSPFAVGWGVYASKPIGGDGAFLRFDARALAVDRSKPDFSFGVSIGFRF